MHFGTTINSKETVLTKLVDVSPVRRLILLSANPSRNGFISYKSLTPTQSVELMILVGGSSLFALKRKWLGDYLDKLLTIINGGGDNFPFPVIEVLNG